MLHTPDRISYFRTGKYIIPVATIRVVENITLEDFSRLKFELSEMF
jgi:hypothetical protein